MIQGSRIIMLAVFVRLAMTLIRTNLHPDEYWQGPQIAHKDVFGYGYLTWEWRRENPIRSGLYIQIFSVFFRILKAFALDNPFIIAYSPRVIQAIFSAIGDIYLYRVSVLQRGKQFAQIVLFINYLDWFSLFAGSRTLINNFQSNIFIIAFYYWSQYLKNKSFNDDLKCRIFATINFMARPTAIIPWIIIWILELTEIKKDNLFKNQLKSTDQKEQTKILKTQRSQLISRAFKIIIKNAITVTLMIFSSITYDMLYYKKLTWCGWNFVKFNVIDQGGDIYFGADPFHWFYTKAIPYLLIGWVPFLLIGTWQEIQSFRTSQSWNENNTWLLANFWIILLSFSGHKEQRFLMPVMPFFFIICSIGYLYTRGKKYGKLLLIIAILLNALAFVYSAVLNNQGSLPAIDYIRNDSENLRSLEILMDCHRTPNLSYIHQDIPVHFPVCSPDDPVNEYKLLFDQPLEFIERRIKEHNPSHILILDYFTKMENIVQLLKQQGFKKRTSIFHLYDMDSPVGELSNVYIEIYSL